MICPKCGGLNVYVKETRGNETFIVHRRRVCADCLLSFWTFEMQTPEKPKKEL